MRKIIYTVSVVTALLAAGCLWAIESAPQAEAKRGAAALESQLNVADDFTLKRYLKECLNEMPAEANKQFALPQKPEDTELIAMVICSDFMESWEKQYWLELLPEMSNAQKNKLKGILCEGIRRSSDPIQRALDKINRQHLEPQKMIDTELSFEMQRTEPQLINKMWQAGKEG